MKLRVRALTTLAAAVAIMGFTATSASAGTHQGAHPAQAANGPTAQLVFDDYIGSVNSIFISGRNQNNLPASSCWTTPLTVNLIPGWWWDGSTTVEPFTSKDCTTGKRGTLNLSDSTTNPPYHCLEDISPFLDWNPGSNWQSCRIPGQTPWNGYAIGQFVK